MDNPSAHPFACTRDDRLVRMIVIWLSVFVLAAAADVRIAVSLERPDTLMFAGSQPDNAVIGQRDSAIATTSEEIALDTMVMYFGEPIEVLVQERKVVLHGSAIEPAKVVYRDMTLESALIVVDLDSSLIRAEGIVDTAAAGTDSADRRIGNPVFRQANQEPLFGRVIEYNMNTRKGRVLHGRTKYEDSYYSGENITRLNSRVLQIKNGTFTTCDLEDHPHYYFRGRQMKIHLDDKVIARDVIMYIEDVPVFYLPFGVFPIRRGRHSGLIIPTFGSSQLEGRYLRGLGYYWAPNDFLDVKGLVDFYEKSGFMFRGDTRYAKRYSLGGNLSGSFTRKNFITGGKERMWDLELNHKQEISPTSRLAIDGSFASSGSYYQNFTLDRNRRITRELISNATYHKSFKESHHNLSINLQRRQDLELGNIQSTLPQLNLSRTTPVYPFMPKGKSGTADSWYENMNFRYSSTLVNRKSKQRFSLDGEFTEKSPRGIQNNIDFLMPVTVMRHINFSPSLRVREEWYDKTLAGRYESGEGIIRSAHSGFAARHLFDGGVSATTKIYGIFAPKIGNVQAIRHVMTPTVNFSYRPDFSDKSFGYFKTVYDTAGTAYRYDRFGESIFGGTPDGRIGSMSLSLGNILQMKTGTPDKEKKYDLFNMNLSTGYNFAAEQYKLNDLITSFRMLSFFDFDMSASHSFYQTDPRTGQRLDKYRSGLPRLQRLQLTTGFHLQGGENGSASVVNENKRAGIESEDEYVDTVSKDKEERFLSDEDSPSFSIPYSLQAGIRYNVEQYNPLSRREIFSTTTTLNFNLTEHWRISHGAEIDIMNRRLIYQDFSFYRDMHCFEFRFNWTPTGALKGYYLTLRIKNPMLRDLKIEDRSYGGSVLGRR